jgi:trimethylamine:corrinoid methyltransferase-like protein
MRLDIVPAKQTYRRPRLRHEVGPNWDNYDTWMERGAVTAEQRANAIWKQRLREYEQPPLDPAIEDALSYHVARVKREGRMVQG